jgi:pyrrolidone-carboxylate peptidase
LHIADDYDFAGNYLCNELSNRFCDLRASHTRDADAGTLHLPRIDLRNGTCLTNRLV